MLKRVSLVFLFTFLSLFAKDKIVLSAIGDSIYTQVSQKILKEAYKELGFDLDIKVYPPLHSAVFANKGVLDGEVHRAKYIKEDYKNLIQVPFAINHLKVVIFSKNPNIKIENWHSLKPYKIAFRRGVIYLTKVTKDMQRVMTNNVATMVDLLYREQIDLIINSEYNVEKYIKEHKLKGIYKLSSPLKIIPLYHYLHKKNAHLIPKLTAVLKKMEKEGLLKKYKAQIIKAYMNSK